MEMGAAAVARHLAALPRQVPSVGVVLAAGASERLRKVTGGGSKALLRLGGATLVERAVRALLAAGVDRVIVVVGHHAGSVATVAKEIAPGRVRTVNARDWEQGNGASLLAAERALASEPLFALVTTDHVFSEGALRELLETGQPSVLVDLHPDPSAWVEGTRVSVRSGRALAFGKGLRVRAIDCGAFLLPPEVFEYLRKAVSKGDGSLAGGVSILARTCTMKAVPLSPDAWWQDVDTPSDLEVALVRLRRSLFKRDDGFVSRFLNRPISTRISMRLAAVRPSPDALSLLAFAMAGAAAILLAGGWTIAAAAGVHLASVLDGVDGEIARLTFRARPRGALLDGVLDRVADSAIIGALGLWTAGLGTPPGIALMLAVAAATGAMLSMAMKDRMAALGLAKRELRFLGWMFAGRDGRLFIVAICAALGAPLFALWAIVSTSAMAAFARLMTAGGKTKTEL